MTLRTAMAVAVFVVVVGFAAIALIVGRFSPKWGDRLGWCGVLLLMSGALTVALMPDTP